MANSKWKTLSSKIAYKNPWIQVREDEVIRPDGTTGIYGVVETRGPSVLVAPITENEEIYLIKQFRYTSQEDSWELPGGSSDNEPVLFAAKRELQEETGLIASTWHQLPGYSYPLNGINNERMYVFVAKNLTQTSENKGDEEGIIEVRKMPFQEALLMIERGQIIDEQTIVGLLKTALWMGYQLKNPKF